MGNSTKTIISILVLAAFFFGCSNSSIYNSPGGQGVSMTLSGFYPSRTGESYALWLEFPKSSIGTKGNHVQHANFVRKLVSAFTISASGSISGFDTTNLVARLGFPLALASYAVISIEKTDSIGSYSRAAFLGGDITGDVSTGTSTLHATHLDGLNYDFTSMAATITLANAPGKPSSDLELYLMNATSPTQISVGVTSLPLLTDPWHYALWAVDSSVKTLPPFNIYYGTFTTPMGVGNQPPDSQPEDNHYNYPGGRYPADSTQPIYNLRSGRVAAMMTLEPITDSNVRPSVPFGAIIAESTIPSSAQGFAPMALTNTAALFPTAQLTIHR